jgi:hypothetical protein
VSQVRPVPTGGRDRRTILPPADGTQGRKTHTGPLTNLTPLSFPSQNQRYTEERDIPRRPATSLGLSSLSGVMPHPPCVCVSSLSKTVAPPGTNVANCHQSLLVALPAPCALLASHPSGPYPERVYGRSLHLCQFPVISGYPPKKADSGPPDSEWPTLLPITPAFTPRAEPFPWGLYLGKNPREISGKAPCHHSWENYFLVNTGR